MGNTGVDSRERETSSSTRSNEGIAFVNICCRKCAGLVPCLTRHREESCQA